VSAMMELVNELYAFCGTSKCLPIGEQVDKVGVIERPSTIAVLKEAVAIVIDIGVEPCLDILVDHVFQRSAILGSSAMRSPSWKRLMPSTRSTMARPGKITVCGAISM